MQLMEEPEITQPGSLDVWQGLNQSRVSHLFEGARDSIDLFIAQVRRDRQPDKEWCKMVGDLQGIVG